MACAPKLDADLERLAREIYGELPPVLAEGLPRLIATAPKRTSPPDTLWSERDVVLITYADQVREPGRTPLRAQTQFLLDHGLPELIRCVHLLPFNPYSSDDGFSVIDYTQVDPAAGTWEDIEQLAGHVDLMFDLVLNHSSQHHRWFQAFLRREPPYDEYYISVDPATDLSAVVRPRSLPLLTPFETAEGTRHVWTTFSADQVDLNYANPRVLLEMLEILLDYARRGARIIRLDAIAFLWKEPGTSCIHLPQTHAVVRLMRRVLDLAAPGTLLLTETNVPHEENLSYFGRGDEAHLVYQFSLPPLLLDALHSGDTAVLANWLRTLAPPFPGTNFFNFTASHDGIGVRPLEGLVPDARLERLVEIVRRHGGRVSTRTKPDGTDSPYELNITYIDAVADRQVVAPAEHARRFLTIQAIMLAMQGLPAVYFHSLVGSPNDYRGVAESGQNRRINRHKYERAELETALSDPDGLQRRVFDGYRRLLATRIAQPAMHPDAAQQVLDLPTDGLLGFVRTPEAGPPVAVLANLGPQPREVARRDLPGADWSTDLLGPLPDGTHVPLAPYQTRWLTLSAPVGRTSVRQP